MGADDIRRVFRDNLTALMRAREIPNPYQLSIFLKGRGVPVSQRTIAYALDPEDHRFANLSTVQAVAAGFGVDAWQLLVPDMNPHAPPAIVRHGGNAPDVKRRTAKEIA